MSLPATVTFAAGRTTLTVPAGAPDDGVATGAKTVTIAAAADGLAGAGAVLVVSDASGPDLALGAGSVFAPATGLTGGRVSVGFRVTNPGRATAAGAWTDAVYLSA